MDKSEKKGLPLGIFEQFPPEIQIEILAAMDTASLGKMPQLSSAMNALLEDEGLWKRACLKRYPEMQIAPASAEETKMTWRERFRAKRQEAAAQRKSEMLATKKLLGALEVWKGSRRIRDPKKLTEAIDASLKVLEQQFQAGKIAGQTVLMHACYNPSALGISWAFAHGASLTGDWHLAASPLHTVVEAATDEHFHAVSALLEQEGVEINSIASSNQNTPLHKAVSAFAVTGRQNLKVIQLLLDAGADMDATNSQGTTPKQFTDDPVIQILFAETRAKRAEEAEVEARGEEAVKAPRGRGSQMFQPEEKEAGPSKQEKGREPPSPKGSGGSTG